ncbi:hypothetical protein CHU98_g9586 [Xylaria longipes]|nr:hypothetical protein CHU98_g9586 [Xylaria longipes]
MSCKKGSKPCYVPIEEGNLETRSIELARVLAAEVNDTHAIKEAQKAAKEAFLHETKNPPKATASTSDTTGQNKPELALLERIARSLEKIDATISRLEDRMVNEALRRLHETGRY